MDDRDLTSCDSDPLPDGRGRRFDQAQPLVDSKLDRERDPLEDVELQPGWEPA